MTHSPFLDRPRVDARDKVMGRLAYAADVALPRLLYAMTVPARIAKGRLTELSTAEASRVPGVVRILTADDFPAAPAASGEESPVTPTITREIAYRGQPVALVVAETLEAAIEGADAVKPTYASEDFSSLVEDRGAQREPVENVVAGDADRAMTRAVAIHRGTYVSPPEHHNPIELLSTTALWRGGKLVVFEGTQGAGDLRMALARTLNLDPSVVEVKSPSIGGAFGQKGAVQRHSALIARAAMITGRPVKFVMPRDQVFQNARFRPKSMHTVQLGADGDGKMIAVRYAADHQQSRHGNFAPDYHDATVQLYGIGDYLGTAANIRLDTQDPGHMRAPHPHPACFAFESAVDELAHQTGRDPVDFRLAHDATVDPVTGKALSSRHLNACIARGADRFGWARRIREPASMTLPDSTAVGWGMASGAYPGLTSASLATLTVRADGGTRYATSGHEMGQGLRTAIAAVLTSDLDIDPDRLEILIGDTAAAPQHTTAGSWGTASVVSAAASAAARMNEAMSELLAGRPAAGNLHQRLAAVRRPVLRIQIKQFGPGQDATVVEGLDRGGRGVAGPAYPDFVTYSYVAHFVEVHVEPNTRRVRVPRVVSVADCGRVVSPRTAQSQVRGAVVWAIGAALREESEVDPRYGGWLNCDLADYLVAVNADVGDIDVSFIDQPDPLINAVGAKGVGEVAMVGAAAAIANAVWHATGRRIRKLPIRVEDLLGLS